MVKAEHIGFSYGAKPVLADVSFSCGDGECVILAGGNGCGKSTALSVTAGILRPRCGEVTVTGRTGYVPQKPTLLEDMTAAENLKFFAGLAGVKDISNPVMGVGDFLKVRVSKMSGGMKKRLSIACAEITKPQIYLMDEPCGALDEPGQEELKNFILAQKAQGRSIVYVSHDPNEFCEFFDKMIFIRDGVSREYSYAELCGEYTSRDEKLINLQHSYALLFKKD